LTEVGMSRANPGGYRVREGYVVSRVRAVGSRTGKIECRECQHRANLTTDSIEERIRMLDAGEVRCEKCAGRMVEG